MQILTYKVKHNRDFSEDITIAFDIANFAINNRDKLSSKYVKHFGLKSSVANQILKKYGRNHKCTEVHNVKLIVPGQQIKYNDHIVRIVPYKIEFYLVPEVISIRNIEIDNEYYYVACEVSCEPTKETIGFLGIDRNAKGHNVVATNTINNKVIKLGKALDHIKQKAKDLRDQANSKKQYKRSKAIAKKANNRTKGIGHKMSRTIVNYASENNLTIVMEKLDGILKNKKSIKRKDKDIQKRQRSLNYTIHSWGFYQFAKQIEYKAALAGIPVKYIDPAYTSQRCSRCGQIGLRDKKEFKCPHCGHADHADVNAAFNIAYTLSSDCLLQDRVCSKGSTDTP